MFEPLQNKYTRIYFQLLNKRKVEVPEGYSERHHIIPKSLGGPNTKDNMVRLTAREHFIAHVLLTKMFIGEAKRKMTFALHLMQRGKGHPKMDRYVPNSHIFALYRKNLSLTPSEATLQKMSASQKARAPFSVEQRSNMSKGIKASYENNPALRELRGSQSRGVPKSAETKLKMSLNGKGKKMPESHREAARNRRGLASARSKTWDIRDPNGKQHLTSSCGDFCKEHGISYYALRNKSTTKDKTTVRRGSTAGWWVNEVTEMV